MAKNTNLKHATAGNKIRRTGIHAKAGSSKLKSSKLYKKPYGRQGRA
jgi:hypothetical protein